MHPERVRIAMAAAIAVAMLVVVMIAAGSAQGGRSGGTGPDTASSGGGKYDRLWDKITPRQKRWARSTSECESGGDANIHGGNGTFHGAFQFMKSTWRNAPKSPGGDPHKRRWKVQAVVAVHLKKRDGARNHWPNCG
jgi:hypothetical protein